MTDREKAEEALVKAGYERKGHGLTIDRVPYAILERWHDHMCDCAYLYGDGTYHLDLRGNTSYLLSLLFPTLTDKERKALTLAMDSFRQGAAILGPVDESAVYADCANLLCSILSRFGGGQS